VSPLSSGRRACLWLVLLGIFAVSACAKQAPVEPAPAQAPAPPQPPQPKPRPANGKGGAANFNPLGLLGGAPAAGEATALKEKFAALLVGTWQADLGDGFAEELTYNPDGTYSAKLTGPMPATATGKYAVLQSVGTRGLKVRLGEEPGARTVTLSFEGDELEHPSLRPGVTGTFRKKP
jgi:hypothetical protein